MNNDDGGDAEQIEKENVEVRLKIDHYDQIYVIVIYFTYCSSNSLFVIHF